MPSQKRASSDNLESSEESLHLHCEIGHKLARLETGELEEQEEAESKAEAEEVIKQLEGIDAVEDDGGGDGVIEGRDALGGIETEEKCGSYGSISENDEEPEFILVELANIRKDVQCPICLGIIKKTRTVMECLHRFCRDCIDKSMRLGNNECPACRTHCASRRSLRDDPNYDALITALYPDIDKYEEEELTFHEEEKIRNKQIQDSIAQVFRRQEALAKRRPLAKDATGTFGVRSQRNKRKQRNGRNSEVQEFDDGDDNDDGGRESSSERRGKRRNGARNMQPSSSSINPDNGFDDNEVSKECGKGIMWSSEIFAWGRGGARSHTRHGNSGGNNVKNSRATRLARLVDYLQRMENNDDDLDIHLMLVPKDGESTPDLQEPYLCCRPTLSVQHLCEYVAVHTPLQAEEIEIMLMVDDPIHSMPDHSNNVDGKGKNALRVLQCDETLAGIRDNCPIVRDPLVLAFRQKQALTST